MADRILLHGLCGTVVTGFFEAGFAEVSVALRSARRNCRSFKSYHDRQSTLKKQHIVILGGSELSSSVTEHFVSELEKPRPA